MDARIGDRTGAVWPVEVRAIQSSGLIDSGQTMAHGLEGQNADGLWTPFIAVESGDGA